MKIIFRQFKGRIQNSVFVIALKMFSKRDRTRLLLVTLTQTTLALFDLVGIALIGAIGSLAVSGISASQVGNRVGKLLEFIGLQDENLQVQISILGATAATFLILKTLISWVVTNRILLFLAEKSAQFSSILVDKLLATNLTVVQNRPIQELIYISSGGVNSIMVGVVGGWFSLVSDMSLLVILGTGLLVIDSSIALGMTVFFVAIAILIYRKIGHLFKSFGESQANFGVSRAQYINEVVLTYREAFVRDRRGYYSKKLENLQFAMSRGGARINLLSLSTKYIFEIVLVATSVLIAGYVFITEPVGRATATLSIFLATSARIIPAIVRVQQGVSKIKLSTGYGQSAIDLMKELKDARGTSQSSEVIPQDHHGFVPRVSITNLKFSFLSGDWQLSVERLGIEPGEFIAFVGASGAGKTTLLDLLLGMRVADEGEISISGVDPQTAIRKWPGAIAYVPQDSSIMPGSIRRNLAIGYEDVNLPDSACWKALEIAHLEGFVRSLPEGLDSYVGDRGTKLSGGQRQRLSIARAFITNPKIIFFDEATSALDGEIEAAISESILDLKGKVTVVMVAHRLSTIVNADRIFYLEDGLIRGEGSFQELKNKNANFARQAKIMGL